MKSQTVDTNSSNVLRRESFNFNQVNIFIVKKIVKFAISSCKKTKGLLGRPTIARNTRHVRLRTKHFGVSRSRLEHALCMRFEK